MKLEPLERAVLEVLLSRQEAGFGALREQFATCRVESRDMTGVGFYTKLVADPASPSANQVESPVGGFGQSVAAEIEGVEHGAGFLLWLTDGRLDTLEGYTYADPWPTRIETFKVTPSAS